MHTGKPSLERVTQALDHVVQVLERNPAPTIGTQVTVHGGSGPTIGLHVVQSGPGIGFQSIAVAGQGNAQQDALIQELRDAIAALKNGTANRSWLSGLFARLRSVCGAAAKGAVEEGAAIVMDYFAA